MGCVSLASLLQQFGGGVMRAFAIVATLDRGLLGPPPVAAEGAVDRCPTCCRGAGGRPLAAAGGAQTGHVALLARLAGGAERSSPPCFRGGGGWVLAGVLPIEPVPLATACTPCSPERIATTEPQGSPPRAADGRTS